MRTKSVTKLFRKKYGPPTFGLFMRAARTMQDLTQKEMAEFIGVPKSMLCDIEKGRQLPSIDLAFKIAKKCGLSEILAVQYAIRDQLRRSGLKLDVEIKKSA